MDFSTGELTFYTNYRRSISSFKAKINTNATEITCYQYLGMTKIFGVQNVLQNRRTLLNSSSGLMAVISRPKASAILVEDLPLSVSLIKSLKNFR
jgi:hypothetical protein